MTPAADKKIMASKIAKVKEFVHGISQNDIVLALHSFDLDVEKTIQALCEDRAAVLEEWECPGAAKKQKNKASKKKGSDTGSVTAEAPSVSSTKTEVVVPTVALSSQPSKHTPQANGYHPVASAANSGNELEWLSMHEKEALQVSALFTKECGRSQDEIRSIFKALRDAFDQREKILLAAVSHSQQEGQKLMNENRKTASSLLNRVRSGRNDATLNADIKAFGSARRLEQQLANTTVFAYDMTRLIDSLNKFGSVVEVTRAGTQAVASPSPIRHAASHSSIISSDHDSGLGGHISPVSVEEKKSPQSALAPAAPVAKAPIAKVEANGIQVASDGLSAEQLQQLQQIMQAQLAASGIDPSYVAGGVANGFAPPRPRRERARDSKKPVSSGAANAKQANGPAKKAEKAPAISILG